MVWIGIISGLINLGFWLILFSRFSIYKQKTITRSLPTGIVYVVIVVKNELKNLKNNLPLILRQNLAGYKVLLVDDGSTDGTSDWIQEQQKNYPQLEYTGFEISTGKKSALFKTIGSLQTDIMVLTDGDCACCSANWLPQMLSGFNDKKSIILGYGPLNRGNTLISLFARFETFMTALQYFSYAISGIPYMGVGRNLAYKLSDLKISESFYTHLNMSSGDDDLVVNSMANRYNVNIQVDPGTFMYSDPPESLWSFLWQKRRHISTSPRYKTKHRVLLGLYSFSHIVFYLSLFFIDPVFAFRIWIIRIIFILLFNYRAFIQLKEKDLLWYFPILDFLMFVYYTFMSFFFLIPFKRSW